MANTEAIKQTFAWAVIEGTRLIVLAISEESRRQNTNAE